MKSTLKESNISLNDIHESLLPQTPPWIIKKPKMIFELNELPKTKLITLQEKFHNILQHHLNHLYVFTDASKVNDEMAYTAVLNRTIYQESPSNGKLHLHSRSPSSQHLKEQTLEFYHILRLALGFTIIK